jgi:hypothetical protein
MTTFEELLDQNNAIHSSDSDTNLLEISKHKESKKKDHSVYKKFSGTANILLFTYQEC